MLEIAARSTRIQDVAAKRPGHAGLGIPKRWRFDQTGQSHGTHLARDRLTDGQSEPIPIETVQEAILQGYRAALDLLIR